ncbi:MAG: DsrE family protein [Thermodesulfovibrionales bacterium]|jgi:predicted peroxiredoxin|nr:DsrE family protein [Thermodesulfovibrionales bacterium]
MGSVCIILRRPPYGSVDASEAVRHALGGLTNEMDVKLILLDGGVAAARKGHNVSGTEYSSIEEGIKDCIDMGALVYADKASMKDHHIESGDIIEGVIIANGSEIAEVIKESDTTMIF